MLLSLLGLNKPRNGNAKGCAEFDAKVFNGKFKVLSEEDFGRVLAVEKERAKRSGRRFILMTINAEGILQEEKCIEDAGLVFTELKKNTRNIDVVGWNKEGRSIGVIFTEINLFDPESTKQRLKHKILKGLSKWINEKDHSKIEMKIFPDESTNKFYKGINNPNLVSDLKVDASQRSAEKEETVGEVLDGGNEEDDGAPASEDFLFGFAKQKLFLFGGDIAIFSALIIGATWKRFGIPSIIPFAGALTTSLIMYFCVFYVFDLYNIGRAFRIRETFPRAMVAVLFGAILETAVFLTVPWFQFGKAAFGLKLVVAIFIISCWRGVYARLFQKKIPKVGALILGSGKRGKFICKLLNSPLSPYQVKGILDDTPANEGKGNESAAVLGTIEQLDSVSEKVWIKAAILATSRNASPEMVRKVLNARLKGLDVVEMATVYERLTGRVPVEYIEDQWLLFAEGFYLISKEYIQRIKRLGDIFVAGGVLLLSLPLMAVTALMIRIDTPGPVFYRQDRVGKGGMVFKIVKFRSMVQNAEAQGAVWAEKGDSRVTRIGHWIRKFRIDELPQLWNVFKGEMSLVGPRPERPEFVKDLENVIPYYGVRHAVPPGVTGWAQVNYPYGASVQDALNKLEYDLYYIKNMSLLLDFKIALKTIGVILLGDGAR